MNINEIFRRLNGGIAEAKDGALKSTNQGEQFYLKGMIAGLEASMKVINDVNFDPPGEVGRLNCLGYGERKGACGNTVPKKFLQLYCNVCNAKRIEDRGGKVSDVDVDVIPFTCPTN